MSSPGGFADTTHKNGEVVITHHGLVAAILRDARATKFLAQIESRMTRR